MSSTNGIGTRTLSTRELNRLERAKTGGTSKRKGHPYTSQSPEQRDKANKKWWDTLPPEKQAELKREQERRTADALKVLKANGAEKSESTRKATAAEERNKVVSLRPKAEPPPFDWRAGMISAPALMAKAFPEIGYVIPGIIPEGLTLFASRPKLGKSWLVFDVGIGVASAGCVMVSIKPGTTGAVLYLALEDNQRRLKRRLSKLCPTGVVPARLHFHTEWPRVDQGGIAALNEWCDAHPDAKLIIIDTLAKIRPLAGNDGYAKDYLAIEGLQKLAGERGISVIVVHHDRKADADDAFDTVSGTLGLTGAADAIMVLKRDTATGMCILRGRGRDIEEFEKAMSFDKATCVWRMLGDADAERQSKERRRIISALGIEPIQPMGPKDIAAAAKMKVENVKVLLGKMVTDGAVEKLEKGLYQLPKRPDQAGE